MLARFGALVLAFLRIAVEEGAWMGVGAGRASDVLLTEVRPEGDLERVVPLVEFAVRNGEAVRDPTGGVPVLEGGLLGRLMVGLSQEEKKSSAGSPAGVEVPSVESARPSSVITTSSG